LVSKRRQDKYIRCIVDLKHLPVVNARVHEACSYVYKQAQPRKAGSPLKQTTHPCAGNKGKDAMKRENGSALPALPSSLPSMSITWTKLHCLTRDAQTRSPREKQIAAERQRGGEMEVAQRSERHRQMGEKRAESGEERAESVALYVSPSFRVTFSVKSL